MKNNIKKDYFWNTIGVFLQNAISPLLLIAVTRINGIFDSGVFSFAFSLAIIFWAFGMWGGRTYQVSDVSREFTHRGYVFVRLMLAVVIIVVAVIFAISNQYDFMKSAIIITLVTLKAIESISDAFYGILQSNDRLFMAGKSLVYKAILGLVTFLIIDIIWQDILIACLALLAVNILVLFTYDIPNVRDHEAVIVYKTKFIASLKEALVIIRRCSPIAVIIFLTMFSLNIPRYYLDIYHQDQVGPFGIIAMPITLLAVVITFVLQPNIVQLSRIFSMQMKRRFDAIVKRLVAIVLIIGTLVFLATYLIGVPALTVVFGVNFEPYKLALLVLVAGAIANSVVSVYINILIIMRSFRPQFFILLTTNILLAVVSPLIVKMYGILGGTSMFAIVSVVQAVFLISLYRSRLQKVATGAA